MARRERAAKQRSEVRQEQMVNAALALIGKDGPKALTVASVAGAIGVVPSALYRHFADKDALVTSILDAIGQRLLANAAAVCQEANGAEARLRLLYLRHTELIRTTPGMIRLVFSEDVCGGCPERKRGLHQVLKGYLGAVADIVRQGQAAGTLCPEPAPATVALMFLGMVQPAAILWHVSEGTFDLPAETEKCWRFFSQAIQQDDRDQLPQPGTEHVGDRPL